MSIGIPIALLDEKTRRDMDRRLRVREKTDPRAFFRNVQEVAAYRIDGDRVAVPLAWGMNDYAAHIAPRDRVLPMRGLFEGILRPEQQVVQKEAIEFLNRQRSILISLYPGGGKTITSLSIASRIGRRTLILVNRIVLVEQWAASIARFFSENVRVQVLDSTATMDDDADFYIMNAINVPKRDPRIFRHIGTVIVDECHLMITKVFVQSLSYLFPRHLIGLSATPYRPDGLDSLLDLYFGGARIHRPLYRKHTVYTVETGIEIAGERDNQGKLNWNSVLQVQMTDPRRNDFIRRLCLFFAQRHILILCKRVSQIQLLADLLRPDATVATLKGSETAYDPEARVLIASIQKVGTGFSHDRLDMLILACDTEEYFLQYLGRVFRRPDVVPVIIDLIDKNPVLKRHARTRRKVYQECGGSLYDFHSIFPDIRLEEEE